MKNVTFYFRVIVITLLCMPLQQHAFSANNLELYTPYTTVSVSPGSSVNYSIDVINKGDETHNQKIYMANVPHAWSYTLTAGGLNINKLAVLPNEKKSLKLKVDVPYKVKKGYYTFYAKMDDGTTLPLTINVSTAGTNESELTCDQKNMEGTSKSSFNFNAILKNKTPNTQQYALMASPPRGWTVVIKPSHKQATSTEIEANGTKTITYEIKPPASVEAGSYKIPVKAISGSTSAQMELEVVITGTYEMSLNTPSGLLSAKITAGEDKKVELLIKNTGSTLLEDIELKASKPKDWEVTFDTNRIKTLEPGKSATVYATIKADKKAIPGDYITKISAKTPEINEALSFRVMVQTSILVGWLGVLIIMIALGGIIFLMKKYGRR